MNQFNNTYKQIVGESLSKSNKKEIAEIFLNILTKQSFESWYQRQFQDFITGEENAPSEEDILKELEWQVSRELNFQATGRY